MSVLFRKTAKGQAEIETRAHRLGPRLRALLIMVDGKRDLTELSAVSPPSAKPALDELLGQGFVELVPSVGPAPAAALVASPGATEPGRATGGGPPHWEGLRRDAVRALTDAAGPAAEALALRMEKARDAEELRPLTLLAARTVANLRGRAAGEAYAARFHPD